MYVAGTMDSVLIKGGVPISGVCTKLERFHCIIIIIQKYCYAAISIMCMLYIV